MPVTIICEMCGMPRITRPSGAREGKGRFCSKRCKDLSITKREKRYLNRRTGYVMAFRGTGRRAKPVGEHTLIVERVLGHPLPRGARVHHVDENGFNNKHNNLVVCPNHRYHALLHRHSKALRESGHADWLHCHVCHKWDDPIAGDMYVRERPHGIWSAHRKCRAQYERARQRRAKMVA